MAKFSEYIVLMDRLHAAADEVHDVASSAAAGDNRAQMEATRLLCHLVNADHRATHSNSLAEAVRVLSAAVADADRWLREEQRA